MWLKVLNLGRTVVGRTWYLKGLTSSKTSRTQAIADLIVCAGVAVASLGIGGLETESVAIAAVTFLTAVLRVPLSRILGYVDPTLKDAISPSEMVDLVRYKDKGWRHFSGSVLDAQLNGYAFGVTGDNHIIDLATLRDTGVLHRELTDAERTAGDSIVKEFDRRFGDGQPNPR